MYKNLNRQRSQRGLATKVW